MLTKKDLNDIGSLIENKINPLDKRLSRVEKVVQKAAKDIDHIKSDISILKTDMKTVKSDIGVLKHDVSYITRTFDSEIIDTKRRVDRIDDTLSLPPLPNLAH